MSAPALGMVPTQGATPVPAAAVTNPSTQFPAFGTPPPLTAQSAPDATPAELLAYLQKRSVDLPLDVQQQIQKHSHKQSKRAIKDLQEAALALGEARTTYEEALLARTQHLSTWKSFLAEAVKSWSEYAKIFEQHEKALQERISVAKEQFQEAKQCLDASKVSAGNVQEISDEEELPGDSCPSAMQITESIQSLSTSLQQLSKEAESIKIEEHAAKRPRVEDTTGTTSEAPSFK